jgi:poly [ADP-ribose] polymerase
VPLDEVQVFAKIVDFLAEVTVFQQYTNATAEALEAKYVFPLDDKSAVVGFEAFINGKHLVGVAKEKEQAHQEFCEAVERGDGAYLLDEAPSGNVFVVSVGNVPAHTTVAIKIRFVAEIAAAGATRKFRLPATLAARQRAEGLGQMTQQTTRVAEAAGAGRQFSLHVAISMPYHIQ